LKRAWFRPKSYGVGMTPASWQGLVVTFVYLAGLIADMRLAPPAFADHSQGLMLALVIAAAWTGLFFWLAQRTCDGAVRWRWGQTPPT
jgi:hypothetical protein